MQAQGGPSRAELWDSGSTERSGDTSDRKKTPSSRPPKRNKKLFPDAVWSRKHLSLRFYNLVEFLFYSLLVEVDVRGRKRGEFDRKLGEEANF